MNLLRCVSIYFRYTNCVKIRSKSKLFVKYLKFPTRHIALFMRQPKKDQSFRIFFILYKKIRGFLKGLQKNLNIFNIIITYNIQYNYA